MAGGKGLTYIQAQERLAQFGPNVIEDGGGRGWWQILADQFKNALVWLMLAAAGVAAVSGEVVDAGLIGAIVALNAVLGWVQEYKAEGAIAKLKQMGAGKVRVRRSDREMEIDSAEVVPGDWAYLEEGGRIAADGRVAEAVELEVDEAVLTGESMPVAKRPGDEEHSARVFAGTMVARGNGWMEVTDTGKKTRFGSLATKLKTLAPEETPLNKKLTRLSRLMVGLGAAACAAVIFNLGWRQGNWREGWSAGVSLAVAVIPEGLPAVVAVTLAWGGLRLAQAKAVVRRMAAVEALGAATVIATDKTGTLTENRMEVKRIVVGDTLLEEGEVPDISHREFAQMLIGGVLASTAVLVAKEDHGGHEVVGEQTEGALLKLAAEAGLVPDMIRRRAVKIVEYPFDSRLRLMSVAADPQGDDDVRDRVVYVKGAPEAVWARCSRITRQHRVAKMTRRELEKLGELQTWMAGKGLRVIGMAYRQWRGKAETLERDAVERNLIWLGMVGIADPLRKEAGQVVSAIRQAGVKVLMVTGDHELTAREIALEAGLIEKEEEVMTGEELDRITDEALGSQIGRVRIFARIAPEQKLRIVKALQANGEVVVMTGDGVNDALAIKRADVGVAMGRTGTDVARETADVVLLDDNLKTILGAVESGRVIMGNITATVKYLLACNLGEVVAILGAIMAGWPSPLLPVQILWVNLVTDGLPALALAVDPGGAQTMNGRGKPSGKWLVGREDLMWMAAAAAAVAGWALLAFVWWGRAGAFTALVAAQMGVALAVRGGLRRRPDWPLILAIGIALGLQGLILAVPGLRSVFRL